MSRNQTPYARSLASVLREALSDTPVVCLAGPRQCGKTTLARVLKPERAFVSLDHPPFLDAASADPAGFVGSLPRDVTIDEVQRAPGLLPAIKLSVDTVAWRSRASCRSRNPKKSVALAASSMTSLRDGCSPRSVRRQHLPYRHSPPGS